MKRFWRCPFEGASLDYASWPLWCGSLEAKIDDRQARQLFYHAAKVGLRHFNGETIEEFVDWINQWEGIERHELDEVKR